MSVRVALETALPLKMKLNELAKEVTASCCVILG